jgi:hypothetical protein
MAFPANLLGISDTRICGREAFRTIYHGLAMVIGAIDALAILLTHQRDYIAASISTMPDGEKEIDAQKLAREKGNRHGPINIFRPSPFRHSETFA